MQIEPTQINGRIDAESFSGALARPLILLIGKTEAKLFRQSGRQSYEQLATITKGPSGSFRLDEDISIMLGREVFDVVIDDSLLNIDLRGKYQSPGNFNIQLDADRLEVGISDLLSGRPVLIGVSTETLSRVCKLARLLRCKFRLFFRTPSVSYRYAVFIESGHVCDIAEGLAGQATLGAMHISTSAWIPYFGAAPERDRDTGAGQGAGDRKSLFARRAPELVDEGMARAAGFKPSEPNAEDAGFEREQPRAEPEPQPEAVPEPAAEATATPVAEVTPTAPPPEPVVEETTAEPVATPPAQADPEPSEEKAPEAKTTPVAKTEAEPAPKATAKETTEAAPEPKAEAPAQPAAADAPKETVVEAEVEAAVEPEVVAEEPAAPAEPVTAQAAEPEALEPEQIEEPAAAEVQAEPAPPPAPRFRSLRASRDPIPAPSSPEIPEEVEAEAPKPAKAKSSLAAKLASAPMLKSKGGFGFKRPRLRNFDGSPADDSVEAPVETPVAPAAKAPPLAATREEEAEVPTPVQIEAPAEVAAETPVAEAPAEAPVAEAPWEEEQGLRQGVARQAGSRAAWPSAQVALPKIRRPKPVSLTGEPKAANTPSKADKWPDSPLMFQTTQRRKKPSDDAAKLDAADAPEAEAANSNDATLVFSTRAQVQPTPETQDAVDHATDVEAPLTAELAAPESAAPEPQAEPTPATLVVPAAPEELSIEATPEAVEHIEEVQAPEPAAPPVAETPAEEAAVPTDTPPAAAPEEIEVVAEAEAEVTAAEDIAPQAAQEVPSKVELPITRPASAQPMMPLHLASASPETEGDALLQDEADGDMADYDVAAEAYDEDIVAQDTDQLDEAPEDDIAEVEAEVVVEPDPPEPRKRLILILAQENAPEIEFLGASIALGLCREYAAPVIDLTEQKGFQGIGFWTGVPITASLDVQEFRHIIAPDEPEVVEDAITEDAEDDAEAESDAPNGEDASDTDAADIGEDAADSDSAEAAQDTADDAEPAPEPEPIDALHATLMEADYVVGYLGSDLFYSDRLGKADTLLNSFDGDCELVLLAREVSSMIAVAKSIKRLAVSCERVYFVGENATWPRYIDPEQRFEHVPVEINLPSSSVLLPALLQGQQAGAGHIRSVDGNPLSSMLIAWSQYTLRMMELSAEAQP